jgi:mechanosensitive ion channel-like protein
MPMMLILQSHAWDDLMTRLNDLLTGTAGGLLDFTLALLVALVGWAVATLVAAVARLLLRAVRFNDGVRGLVGGAAPRHEPAAIAAWAIYWSIIVVALMLALDTMGLTLSFAVTQRLSDVLPRIVASGVLLAIGVLVAMLLGALTRRFFDSAGLRGGRLRGQVVAVVLTGFAILVALEQLGFAAQFVMAIGIVAIAAVGLALGLAFGLGCRDLARDFVVEYLRSLDEQGPQRPA